MEHLKSFEELKCWQEAVLLRKSLIPFLDSLPKYEEYRLKDQVIRASRSVTNNIAEGYGRFNYQENVQFCRISRGSLFEIIDHLIVAVEESYMTEEDFLLKKEHVNKCLALLNGYINYLLKAKVTSKEKIVV
jgi:four helix bundle protein